MKKTIMILLVITIFTMTSFAVSNNTYPEKPKENLETIKPRFVVEDAAYNQLVRPLYHFDPYSIWYYHKNVLNPQMSSSESFDIATCVSEYHLKNGVVVSEDNLAIQYTMDDLGSEAYFEWFFLGLLIEKKSTVKYCTNSNFKVVALENYAKGESEIIKNPIENSDNILMSGPEEGTKYNSRQYYILEGDKVREVYSTYSFLMPFMEKKYILYRNFTKSTIGKTKLIYSVDRVIRR